MPGSHTKHHPKKCSESEKSDSESCTSSVDNHVKKHHKKHTTGRERSRSNSRSRSTSKSDSRSSSRSRSNSRSSSRSRSNSHTKTASETDKIECYTNDKDHKNKCKKDKHHKHKKDNTDASSESEYEFDFCDIYQYFKNCLVEDKQLQIAGSDAYIEAVDNTEQTVPTTHAFVFNQTVLKYGIDRYEDNSAFFVREDGVYLIFFMCATDSSAQFTIFINAIPQPVTTIGANAGAGQIISKHILKLRKNDCVVVRNYVSTANSIRTNPTAGGLLAGIGQNFLAVKIAPYCAAEVDCDNEHKFMDCLSHKKKHLFKKIACKLLQDKQLMPKGFNVHGSFLNRNEQIINPDADVVFNETTNVNEMYWDPIAPSQVKIQEDGVYKIFFVANTNTAAQLALAINGVPSETTIQGTNKGATQLSIRTLRELKCGDLLTIRNHTSAVGPVILSAFAGGKQNTISAAFIIIKVAPLDKPTCRTVNCEIEKYYRCYYPLLRDYLLYKDNLLIAGSNAYLSTISAGQDKVDVGKEFKLAVNVIAHNLKHPQGANYAVIRKTGIYDVCANVITDEPLQYALFVNGVPKMTTIYGRDSGANRCLLKQLVKLKKGDSVTLVNYESDAGLVRASENPGGSFVGQNCQLSLFLLKPICHSKYDECKDHTPKEYCKKPKVR